MSQFSFCSINCLNFSIFSILVSELLFCLIKCLKFFIFSTLMSQFLLFNQAFELLILVQLSATRDESLLGY